ncbi:PREDICTED: ankyrin repeat and SOCS box protein 13-like isoform X1 [Branchiostoma belcheri]|uniref:Ankyrin repeat and SOCS box protein 13-like isoform X1 n=1 Tax=Branchiostoma belcheri TaxID=7741 RepID=A0A6P4YIZ6_BRABE|nr:PREDICTED: ankyrin repeat and SOCS box protein 13-like isoform X1 [Branchiostoma belcheri]
MVKFGPGSRLSVREGQFNPQVARDLFFYYSTVLLALFCFRILIKVSLCLFQYYYVVRENRRLAKKIYKDIHKDYVYVVRENRKEAKRINALLHGNVGSYEESYLLHDAAANGQAHVLRTLIEQGANVNFRTPDWCMPLHEACLGGHYHCAQALIKAGAKLNPRTIDGDTPLTFACSRGSVSCVKLLLHHGISPDPGLFTKSPLHEACFNGRHEVVEVLIEAGADVETVDSQYGSPLHVVCSRSYPECAELLLRAGANVNATKNYETALHVAAKTGSAEVVQVLLEYGANINAKDISQQRPVDLTDPGSEVRKILTYRDAHPRHLMQLCRLRIRHLLGRERVKYVQLLRLPPLLQDYVLYKFLE